MNKYIPVYKIPSELLHGEAATSSGMVKGCFTIPSRGLTQYKEPSLGSGKYGALYKEKKCFVFYNAVNHNQIKQGLLIYTTVKLNSYNVLFQVYQYNPSYLHLVWSTPVIYILSGQPQLFTIYPDNMNYLHHIWTIQVAYQYSHLQLSWTTWVICSISDRMLNASHQNIQQKYR